MASPTDPRDAPRAVGAHPSAGDTVMRPMRAAVLATLLAAATAHANAERAPTRYFDLVNASHDSVTSLAIAPAGSDAFREVELGVPLRGGLTSTTVDVADGDCLRDFRLVYRDGRTLIYPDIDVCRYRSLRLTAQDGKAGDPRARAVAEKGPD
jgi:hypothetical protein